MINNKKKSVLSEQNAIMKFLIVLSSIFIVQFSHFKLLLLYYPVTIIYLMFSKDIFLHFFKGLLRFTPFFVVYFLFGIFFKIDFLSQVEFIIRISFYLLLSFYLIVTTSLDRFLSDFLFMQKNIYLHNFQLFIVHTLYFIPVFFQEFRKGSLQIKQSKFSFSKIISLIENSLQKCLLEIHKVDLMTNIPYNQKSKFKIFYSSNIILSIYFLIIIGIRFLSLL